MRTDQSITVDGHRYSVKMLPGTQGNRQFLRLTKILGEALVRSVLAVGSSKGSEEESEHDAVTAAAISAVTGGLLDKVDPDDLDDLIKAVLSTTTCEDTAPNGEKFQVEVCADFDVRFAGQIFHLYKLFFSVAKVQFSDFIVGFSVLGKGLRKPASKSPKN